MTDDKRRPLKLLLVEDTDDDVELELAHLRQAGFDPEYTVVDGPAELHAALDRERWDIIVSDYAMPGFTGLDALEIVKARGLAVPFVLVSGTVGEDVAVEAMRAGAQDYVLKSNLTRLALAVERELAANRTRREAMLRRSWQDVLARSGRALNETLDTAEVLRRIARMITETVTDVCAVDVADEAGTLTRKEVALSARHRGVESRDLSVAHPARWPHGERAMGEIAVEPGFAALCRDVRATAAFAVPMRARGRLLGVLNLGRRDEFDPIERELAEEVAQRAALAIDNAKLYAAAVDAIRVREDFVAIAAHELKTPMTAMRLHLEGARDIANRPDLTSAVPLLQRRVMRALATADRMSALTDMLLDATQLSAQTPELKLQQFDLVRAVAEVAERMTDHATRVGSVIRVQSAGAILGEWDRLRLEQVATNLLSNALKYGRGQPVEIRFGQTPETASFSIVDYGIGLAPEDVVRLFQRFERAAPLQHYGGLGLGLFITRQIVEAHGGRVSATGAPGQGAIFTVELPLRGVVSRKGT